jgi:cell division protein FtsW
MSRAKRGSVLPKELRRPARTSFSRLDYPLLFAILGISLFGLLMVYDASVVVASGPPYNNKFYFLQQQGENLLIGLTGLFVASRINYHFWRKLAPAGLLIGLTLLVLVFVPGLGVQVYGAKRWLNVGVTTLQPAYLLCFALIIYLASWLADNDTERHTLKGGMLPFGLLLGSILFVVVILQKDLGTGLILALTSLGIYFLSGSPLKHLFSMLAIGSVAGVVAIIVQPHRMARVLTFFGSASANDKITTGYHINQVKIALGSGGWLGVGFGQSRQKYNYIPEVQTDSIFAIFGEELGFIGSIILVAIFGYIIWRGLMIALRAEDMFGRLLAGGIMMLLGVQMFVNLFAMTAIIPLTGVPLPFISNGGTSLIVLLFSMGIVLNISRQSSAVRS